MGDDDRFRALHQSLESEAGGCIVGRRRRPKEPIIFWIEKTVPFKYRKPIRDGIVEWNKAFEKAGFVNAIEVRQQPDDADWDPEDINYNTFRWITASAGFAMGPSRVNPYTGQILDADIIFDSDFLESWKTRVRDLYAGAAVAALTGRAAGPGRLPTADGLAATVGFCMLTARLCCSSQGMSLQMAFGRAACTATRRSRSSWRRRRRS